MCEKKARPHAELIKAWADGGEIQFKDPLGVWNDIKKPSWLEFFTYRIKPEPKPDVVQYRRAFHGLVGDSTHVRCHEDNLKLTFDGETGKLKAVELI